MHFLSFYTIKTIDFMDGSCEITWCSDVTSHKPCNITLFVSFAMSRPADYAIVVISANLFTVWRRKTFGKHVTVTKTVLILSQLFKMS